MLSVNISDFLQHTNSLTFSRTFCFLEFGRKIFFFKVVVERESDSVVDRYK